MLSFQKRGVLQRIDAGEYRVLTRLVAVDMGRDFFAMLFATATTASMSARVISGAPGSVPIENTAPDAITFKKSAPAKIAASARVANSSGVLAIPCCDSDGISSGGNFRER